MSNYKHAYPAETTEVDANMQALQNYFSLLQDLQNDDLPRHKAHFKQLLTENTINSIAMFHSNLDKVLNDIHDNIDTINPSLKDIEYSPGTTTVTCSAEFATLTDLTLFINCEQERIPITALRLILNNLDS